MRVVFRPDVNHPASLQREPDKDKKREKIDDWRGKARSKAPSDIDMRRPKGK